MDGQAQLDVGGEAVNNSRMQSVRQNLDLASYLVIRWRSHCTSPSNWELPLLCYPTLQGTSSSIKFFVLQPML